MVDMEYWWLHLHLHETRVDKSGRLSLLTREEAVSLVTAVRLFSGYGGCICRPCLDEKNFRCSTVALSFISDNYYPAIVN